jgi:hypothetical protein
LSPETQSARGNGRFTKPPTQKLAQRLDDNHERLPLLPLGHLHPYDRCWRCGGTSTLRNVVVCATLAAGRECDDLVECLRRRARAAA